MSQNSIHFFIQIIVFSVFGTNKSRGVGIVILNLNINVKHFYLESPLSMMERTLKGTVAGTNPEQSLNLSKWRSSEERMLRKWSQCGRWSDKTPGMLLFRPPRLWTIMLQERTLASPQRILQDHSESEGPLVPI